MLWKCCTQYVNKFGKLSSKQSTGKRQCSFQSQRRATPKNIQTTVLISNPGIESTSSAYFTHLLTGVIINIITSLSSFTLVTIMLLDKINVKSGFKTGWALSGGFLGGTVVKNLLAMQKMRVWSLSREDTLEEEMAAHSSVLAWKIPWTEQSGVLQSPKNWTQLSNSQQQWFHNVTLSERDQILKIRCLSIYMNNNNRQNSCVDNK